MHRQHDIAVALRRALQCEVGHKDEITNFYIENLGTNQKRVVYESAEKEKTNLDLFDFGLVYRGVGTANGRPPSLFDEVRKEERVVLEHVRAALLQTWVDDFCGYGEHTRGEIGVLSSEWGRT